MVRPAFIPMEDYVSGAIGDWGEWELDPEYVDGDIVERFGGERPHADWKHALLQWFGDHAQQWNIRVALSLRVQVSETRIRVPDIVVWRRDAPREQMLTRAPFAVFEVLSPEDEMASLLIKLEDYERMGIRTIRVIDPANDQILRFVDGRLEPADVVDPLDGSLCHLDWVKIREITRSA